MLIPLFPLNVVLFPGSSLPLRVFERRYLDMVSTCLRDNSGFGICLIQDGREVGTAATPHSVGTLGRISDWEQRNDGLLGITVHGESRFLIERHEVGPHQLLMAEVRLLDNTARCSLPEEFTPLADLLRRILEQLRGHYRDIEPQYHDADWVSYRLGEILPLPLKFKQQLLEISDPIERLTALQANLSGNAA